MACCAIFDSALAPAGGKQSNLLVPHLQPTSATFFSLPPLLHPGRSGDAYNSLRN
jgi:hypothetical protein